MWRLILGLLPLLVVSTGVRAAPAVTAAGLPQVLVMLRMAPQHFRPDAGYGGSYGDGEGRSARWRIARRLAEQQGVAVVGEWPMPVLGIDCYVMTVPAGRSPEDVAIRFGLDPEVSWSEPIRLYRAQAAGPAPSKSFSHNDPLYPLQPAAREWRLADLHSISTGRGVRVAVIDSAVDADHPDLVGQVGTLRNFVSGRPMRPEDHGTAVAGIIAAKADNGLGIAGVAPQATIMGLRACWQEKPGMSRTFCDSLSLAKALDYAIGNGAAIINMSLTGPDDRLLARFVDAALARNIVVVAAFNPAAPGGFPASHRGVIAVAAEGSVPPNTGVLAAPGRDVPTTLPGGRWDMENGSSFAAAHVSGLFALLKQRAPHVAGAASIVVDRRNTGIDACATLLQESHPDDRGCAGPQAILAMAAGPHQPREGP